MAAHMHESPLVGVGLYEPRDVARILRLERGASHLTPRRSRDWAMGSDAPTRRVAPVFERELNEVAPDVLTFQDMMEIFVIATLRYGGLSLRRIRVISDRLRELLQVGHPLTVARVWTDGVSAYADLLREANGHADGAALVVEDLLKQQLVIDSVVRPFARGKLEFDGVWPARYYPLGDDRRVVIDPKHCFGRPQIAGAGVETAALYECYKAEGSLRDVAAWFDLDFGSIQAGCAYEAKLRDESAAA